MTKKMWLPHFFCSVAGILIGLAESRVFLHRVPDSLKQKVQKRSLHCAVFFSDASLSPIQHYIPTLLQALTRAPATQHTVLILSVLVATLKVLVVLPVLFSFAGYAEFLMLQTCLWFHREAVACDSHFKLSLKMARKITLATRSSRSSF